MAKDNGGNHASSAKTVAIPVGGLRALLNKGADVSEANSKAVEAIREEAPIVADILGGSPQVGENPGIEPGSITIYVRQGQLKWSAIVKSEKLKFFGDLADITKPLQSINCALMLGEYGVGDYTEQKPSYTEAQKKVIL